MAEQTASLEERFLAFYDSCSEEEQEVLTIMLLATIAMGAEGGDPEVTGFLLPATGAGQATRANELGMIQLQSLTSQRQMAVQLSTRLLDTQRRSSNSVIHNLGG